MGPEAFGKAIFLCVILPTLVIGAAIALLVKWLAS